ncbi:mucoidy inhibitor MuiA family protein [Aliterella atlantica]|uniref:Mucoidy inhibitor A n=1 Tax=Aliterella atlantica CENA595 TaxID=1618023 RepID=A0A0D8ZX40_9CYAN|nr:mucoidy inhibitor MuiA family protein [Aliterella atlantica]KJH73014.1 hypothetical protein UH38_02780 [Aliterella atlantica CENA595]
MNSATPPSGKRTTVNTQIDAVTVYTDRALVTRRGKVTLTGQEQELELTLPASIQTESVRASGKGAMLVKLLGVSTERLYAKEPVEERVANLEQQLQQLETQKRSVQDTLQAAQLQRSYVQSISEKSVERLARHPVNLDDTTQLLNFIGQQYSQLSNAIAQQEEQRLELDKQLIALRKQLQQLNNPKPKERFSVIVGIESQGEGDFELEVSYIVNRASWIPLYDMRVNRSNLVNLSYLAEVQQSSGEDWQNVALTLSTAKPGLGTLPPKLHPWYIDVRSPQYNTRKRARRSADTPSLAEDDFDEMVMMAAAPAGGALIEAENVETAVSREGGVVTFQVSGGSNIPSDGAPHKITIFSDNYPCQLQYIAMPRLVSFAYLQAKVTNSATGAILPGKANIFRDNMFVGTTQLENIAPNQEFELNLGIDEGLKIERDLIERQVDKKLLVNQRRITYAYRLKVTNLLEREAKLKLIEQLPVSRNEQVKIRLNRSNPQIQIGEMGVVEWAIALPPQAQQEFTYQFTIEHPPEITVIGLDI